MKQAAVMLIINDGLILSISRRNNKRKFGLAGGKSDLNELPKDTAIRECFEETGIHVSECVLIYRRDETIELPDGEDFHTYCYYALDWSGEPKSSEEGEVKWLTAKRSLSRL